MNRPDPWHWGLRQIVREEQQRHAEHPSPARIAAYQRGELAAGEAAAIVEHLGFCAECTDLALEAAAFFADDQAAEAGAAGEAEDDDEVEAEWQRFRRAVEPEATATLREPPPLRVPRSLGERPPRPPLVRRLGFAYGLAAALAAALALAVVIPMGSRFARPVPRPNERSYDLTPPREARGAPSDPTSETVIDLTKPGSSAHLTFGIPLGSDADGTADYILRLRAEGGDVLWEADGLRPDPIGALQLGLPRGAFPAGRYRIEVLPSGGEGAPPLEVLRIAIRQ